MIEDAVLLTISCSLFVNMGLADAIQEVLHFKFHPLSCLKCLNFWANLLWLCFHYGPSLRAVTVSFICSYLSLWITLWYDALSVIYNKAYETISKTQTDTDTDSSNEVS